MALSPVAEYELQAAYLYNFALFTTWPAEGRADEEGALQFCVATQEPQAAAIAGLQTRKVRQRSIQVRQLESADQGAECDVLFIGAKGMEQLPELLAAIRDSDTLTVTDLRDGVAWREAAIGMAVENGRLAFDVNLLNVRRARLTLSSKLLKLARSVH